VIDFQLSNLSNSDIDQIQIYVRENPRSLTEHVRSVGTYDINWGHVAAGTTIAMVPAIVLFTCMKDVFIENIGGAVKE